MGSLSRRSERAGVLGAARRRTGCHRGQLPRVGGGRVGTGVVRCGLRRLRGVLCGVAEPDRPRVRICPQARRSALVLAVLAVGGLFSAASASAAAPTVYFIGDSVTAGFGFCGTEGGSNSAHITCRVNGEFANSWYFGDNSLSDCTPLSPPMAPNDRCSNNNDRGNPWNAGPWKPGPAAPTVAYPFVIARDQSSRAPAQVTDWAVTGSTPADWDTGGSFHPQLTRIKDSFVVMTLGANPLLSDYLKIELSGYPATVGKCADSTVLYSFPRYYAAALNAGPHGVLKCFDREWAADRQDPHLAAIYRTLLQNGNDVLVMGYPMGCPWSFGNFQPQGNIAKGPAQGNPCTSESYPNWDHPSQQTSQWQQAELLGRTLNGRIESDVNRARADHPGRISFVLPNADWANHQAWSDDGRGSWFFKQDTWVHPNRRGHEQLAATVEKAMCRDFKHWCGSPPAW